MMINKTCILCEKPFVTRFENSLRCPECNDKRKNHDAHNVAVSRNCVESWICKIALPESKFEIFETDRHDNPSLRAIFRGKDGGYVDWCGRLDVYVSGEGKTETPTLPNFGRVRLMEVEKMGNPKKKVEGKPDLNYDKKYQYLAIDPFREELPENNIDGTLIYRKAHSKYTIKGYGRQYSAHFITDECLWFFMMSCRVRSGRASVDSLLAIVGTENPLIRVFSENGHDEKVCWKSAKEEEYVLV